jgi:hypothetical protein
MSTSEVTFSTLDYSKERSNVRFNITQITAANLVAEQGDITDLGTAITGISLNTLARQIVVLSNDELASNYPTDVHAQRENKWLIRYEDTTTHQVYRNEVPGADLTLLATNSDMADLSLTAWTDFITAFEAVVKSPDGNAVNFLDAEFVGKRL